MNPALNNRGQSTQWRLGFWNLDFGIWDLELGIFSPLRPRQPRLWSTVPLCPGSSRFVPDCPALILQTTMKPALRGGALARKHQSTNPSIHHSNPPEIPSI